MIAFLPSLPAPLPPLGQASRAATPSARLLMVDDDPVLRMMVGLTLGRAGYHVVEADSGLKGLEQFGQDPVDLVILDVQMPGIDGYETCRRLRALPGGAAVPVLMLTGLSDPNSVDLAYQAGATDFVAKPINWTLLTHRVRYVLRSSAAAVAFLNSRERLARAQRLAHMGSWEMQADSGTVFASSEMARIFECEAPQTLAAAPAGEGQPQPGPGEPAAVHAGGWQLSPERFMQRVRKGDRERVAKARAKALHQGLGYSLSYTIERPDGATRTLFEQSAPMLDSAGRQVGIEGITQDVTERVEAERQMRHMALHDSLTGLPNRDFFFELAAPALDRARRGGSLCAVLSIDLDRFKSVNDAHGQAAGDAALRLVATRLRLATRGGDVAGSLRSTAGPGAHVSATAPTAALADELVARIGSNGFTLLLTDIENENAAASAAQRISQTLSEPMDLGGRLVELTASVGVALYPRDHEDSRTLTRFAEQALYEAKGAGRGQTRFFDAAMNKAASTRLAREIELRHAIADGQLRLHLQPKVNATVGAPVGAEALVRWLHPLRGLVPPGEFIPLAEETGLIAALTDWVVDESCRALRQLDQQGIVCPNVAVNFASPSFLEEGFVQRLATRVAEQGVAPARLTIEVTESLLMNDLEASIARMKALQSLGFSIALDDFGTGYSSLSHLKRLPIDELKIDRSFVADACHSARDRALVRAIIELGHNLGLRMVAEGVETEQQRQALLADGCPVQQGYWFAKPMPVEQFALWLQERQQPAPSAATTSVWALATGATAPALIG